MNKTDLVSKLSDRAALTKVDARAIVDDLFDIIHDALVGGDRVVISDFGTFTVSARRGFQGKNPRTGDAIDVPPRKIPVFRCGKGLKEALNPDIG